jgi:hypothetical protein
MTEQELKDHINMVSQDTKQFEIEIINKNLTDLADICRKFHTDFGGDIENLTYDKVADDIDLWCATVILPKINTLYEEGGI